MCAELFNSVSISTKNITNERYIWRTHPHSRGRSVWPLLALIFQELSSLLQSQGQPLLELNNLSLKCSKNGYSNVFSQMKIKDNLQWESVPWPMTGGGWESPCWSWQAVTECGVRRLVCDDNIKSFWHGDRCGMITSHITGIISRWQRPNIGVKYLSYLFIDLLYLIYV